MSDASESKPPLDLSELRLMPKWVSDFSKTPSRTEADFGDSDTREHRGPRDRDQRGGGGGGGYRGDQRGGPPRGDRRPGPGGQGGPPRDARSSGRGDDRRGGSGGGYRDRGSYGRDDRGGRPAYDPGPQPVAGLKVHVEPDAKATEAMAAMIRSAGKAYSVFDAARLVLASGDRFHVKFSLAPDNPQKLYAVPSASSLWLGKEEALSHFLEGEGISEYYRVEELELEAPKGNFNSVAVCGMSGELLGPPSHHSYQANLHKIHRERYANMNFEDYKRRVRTDTTPEAIEKWKESQTHGRQWVALKDEVAEGAEPATLKSRSEMETHFRKHYADSVVREVSEATVAGNIPKNLLSPALYLHLRGTVEEARKHLLQTAQQLCTGFEHQGLKLFKRRGGKLWVSRTRPRTLDAGTVLSVRIAKIIDVVKNKPGITTKELVEVIAPAPATPEPAPEKLEQAPEVIPTGETAEETASVPAPEPAAEAPVHHGLSDEQLLVLKDLHWLNSEGYVIEYADGIVYPGVTEPPPPKPKPIKEAASPAADKPAETDADVESLVASEEGPALEEAPAVVAKELHAPAEVVPALEQAIVADVVPPVSETPVTEEAISPVEEPSISLTEEAPAAAAEELPVVEEAVAGEPLPEAEVSDEVVQDAPATEDKAAS